MSRSSERRSITDGIHCNDALDVMSVPICGGTLAMLASRRNAFDGTLAPLGPQGLAVDTTHAYWIDPNGDGPTGFGTIMNVPLRGGTPATLARAQLVPFALTIDAKNVYWLNLGSAEGDGALLKTALGGGNPTTLVSGLGPGTLGSPGIGVDAESVYWSDARRRSIQKVPLHGGGVASVAASPLPGALVVGTSAVFWIDSFLARGNEEGVLGASLAGGAIATLARSSITSQPSPIAADEASVYWLANNPTQPGNSLVKVRQVGSRPTVLASSPYGITAMAVDRTSIYWSTPKGLMRGPK